MATSDWQKWFEEVWEHREEVVYPQLFGPIGRGIFTLTPKIFEVFDKGLPDPRWLHCGVFEIPPTQGRSSWLYVTSGMSNAWEDDRPDPEGPSGFGCEFVFESVRPGDWAILRLLHLMAFQILLVHGRYPNRGPMTLDDRIPLHGPITPEPSQIQWLMVAPAETCAARFNLASGWVDLYAIIGVTEEEAGYARERGGEKLVKRLKKQHAFPVTDSERESII